MVENRRTNRKSAGGNAGQFGTFMAITGSSECYSSGSAYRFLLVFFTSFLTDMETKERCSQLTMSEGLCVCVWMCSDSKERDGGMDVCTGSMCAE